MNFQRIAVLTGLSVACVLGSGALSPAHAILTRYNVTNTTFSNGGTLSGSFQSDGSVYQDINLNVTAGTTPGVFTDFTYTSANSTVSDITSSGFRLDNTSGTLSRFLALQFDTSLPLSIGSSTTLSISPSPFVTATNEIGFDATATSLRGVTGGIVTAVPWETDALPLVGATIAFGAGAVAKRKIAQAKSKNLNFEPVKSECLSNVG
jgi:hypothetical protein